ncbi:DUF397 domain-containing protein [Streptomyces subrutilus]|uniref:DUF397 domain-containing protein n=1 Tax=Streptomyces subrutilus TaxID=36818 RepID=UPI00340D0C78
MTSVPAADGTPVRGCGPGGSRGDSCVEVAARADAAHVRDSEVAAGPGPAVAPGAWTLFLTGVTSGRARGG